MKKKIIELCFLLFVTITIEAQNPIANMSSNGAMPSMKWLSDSIMQMGQLVYNKPAKVLFEFENIGSSPLLISRIEPSCGCTSVEFSKEPILSGKRGYIKTEYNASSIGFFSKTLVVYANIPEIKRILTIKGEVIQK